VKKSACRWTALVFLAGLLAVNCYRAATQSIVHDEALTWQIYLAGPASTIFQYYDANNHFLATILFRISTALFGVSEFAMRLPTLLAGAWFLWTALRLCTLIAGEGWSMLIGIAALTLNPLLLDFLVAARGYGLAIAGLFWGLYQMLAWFDERARGLPEGELRKRLWKAALGMSIAVAANLTMLIPAFVMAVLFCVLLPQATTKQAISEAASAKTRKKSNKPKPRETRRASSGAARVLHFSVPVAALAVIFFLAAPIDAARAGDFYVGTATARASLENLAASSFAYTEALRNHAGRGLWLGFAIVFLLAAPAAALIVALRRRAAERTIADLAMLITSVAVIGSAALLVAAHWVVGLPYPQDRTGLYFVPLATLAAFALAGRATVLWRKIILAILIVVAAAFAAEWNTSSFLVWRYDADTKRIFETMEKSPRTATQALLGASWVLEPSLNFYRVQRRADWLAQVRRDGFGGARQFYVVARDDRGVIRRRGLRVIYAGLVSGTLLAVPGAPSQ